MKHIFFKKWLIKMYVQVHVLILILSLSAIYFTFVFTNIFQNIKCIFNGLIDYIITLNINLPKVFRTE